MTQFKNLLIELLLIISCVTVHAGNGSSFGAGFGGGLLGGMVGGALTQPRSTRTEVVQVPVQQAPAPAPRNDYDDSVTVRKLRKENRALLDEIEELTDEVVLLKKEIKKLKSEKPTRAKL